MNISSVGSASTALATSNVKASVGISVLKNEMDRIEQTGEDLAKMLSTSSVDIKL